MRPSSADSFSDLQKLRKLHGMAWGKQWPHQHANKISLSDIYPSGTAIPSETGDPAGSTLDYTCYGEMRFVSEACGGQTSMLDVLVIRDEYTILVDALERLPLSTVLTGQPGTGAFKRVSRASSSY